MQEKVLLNAVLCFLVKRDEVLLGLKTKKIGQGCWNGYGGGIEGVETPKQAVIRETGEEARIEILSDGLERVAMIDFHNTKRDGTIFTCRVPVYLSHQWEGEPQSTEEMVNPTWFKKRKLPLDKMMLADKEWLPIVLAGKKIIADAKYGPFQRTLLGKVNIAYVDYFVYD